MKKHTFVRLMILTLFTLSAGSAAWAGDAGNYHSGKMMGHTKLSSGMHFPDIDTDGNGVLSLDEFKTRFPRTTENAFSMLDSDKNGELNHDEWEAFEEMHRGMGAKSSSTYHDTAMPDASTYNAHFPDMDADGNDQVSLSEFKTYFSGNESADAAFKAIDTDQSSSLDHDEWHAFKKAHKLGHKE